MLKYFFPLILLAEYLDRGHAQELGSKVFSCYESLCFLPFRDKMSVDKGAAGCLELYLSDVKLPQRESLIIHFFDVVGV